MQIVVKTLMGEKIELEIKNQSTIGDIKEKIWKLKGYPCDQQRLIFDGSEPPDKVVFYQGCVMERRQRVLSYSVESVEPNRTTPPLVLYLVLRLRGGGNEIVHRAVQFQRGSSSGSDDEVSDECESEERPQNAFVSSPVVGSHASSFPLFKGSNFSEWRAQVQFHLKELGYDLALHTEIPNAKERKQHEAWRRSNEQCLEFMLTAVASNIKFTLPRTNSAKEFFQIMEERFSTTNEFLKRALMADLTTRKFDGTCGVYEHAMEMINIANRLMTLGLNVDESFLVQFILNSLPSKFEPFQVFYNNINGNWRLNELINMLVREEARLKQVQQHSMCVGFPGAMKKWRKRGKGIKREPPKSSKSARAHKKERNDEC